MMIVSIGLSIFLRNIYQYFSGAQSRNYSQYTAVHALGVRPDPHHVARRDRHHRRRRWCWSATTSLLQFTRLGKATRAVADNPALVRVDRHQRRAGHLGGLDRRCGAGRPVRRAAGADPGLRLPDRLQDPAAGLRRRACSAAWAPSGARSSAPSSSALFTELTTLFVPAEFKFVGALLVLIIVLLITAAGTAGQGPAGRLRKGTHGHPTDPQPLAPAGPRPHRGHLRPGRHRPQRPLRLHRAC